MPDEKEDADTGMIPQLKLPVNGFEVSCPFGKKGKSWKDGYHGGTDWPCPTGTPIYAALDGVVGWADNADDGFGFYIRVHHFWKGLSLRTYYAHLYRSLVQKGQEVRLGEMIAESGNSGNVVASGPAGDGSHLHFEVRLWDDNMQKWVKTAPTFFDEIT